MKKLLTLMASMTLMASPITTVIACGGPVENPRDKLDLWSPEKYAEQLDDLQYEVIETDTDFPNYRLISEKRGLDFVIKQQEESKKSYEVANKSIRIKDFDIDNYDETTTIDSFAAFSATEGELPKTFDEFYIDGKAGAFNEHDSILGEVKAKNLNSESDLKEHAFYFIISEERAEKFLENEIYMASFNWDANLANNDGSLTEKHIIDAIWENVMTKTFKKLALDEKDLEKYENHFKKYSSLEIDSKFDPKRLSFQTLHNPLRYDFKEHNFEVDLWVVINKDN